MGSSRRLSNPLAAERVTIKYFYQEMLERNSLALISAHHLADQAKTVAIQKYICLSSFSRSS